MPITGTSNTPITPPAATRRPPPGFTVGANDVPVPEADDKVWNLFVAGRPVNTADAHTSQAIDGWEGNKLLALAQKNPKEFLQRLLADSSNGTPVEKSFTKEIGNWGVLKVDFSAKDGDIRTTAKFDIYNKVIDPWIGPYTVKDSRPKNTRTSLTIDVAGKLNLSGGVDDVKIEISGANIPKFDAMKMLEIDKLRKQLKAAMRDPERTKKEKESDVLRISGRAIRRVSEFPILFFLDLIDDYNVLNITVKEEGELPSADATVGNGNYNITFDDLLGESDGEANIGAVIAGKGDDYENTVTVDTIKAFNSAPWSLEWDDEGKPAVFRTDPETGDKSRIDDHAGEFLMYLPMAMALAGDNDIF